MEPTTEIRLLTPEEVEAAKADIERLAEPSPHLAYSRHAIATALWQGERGESNIRPSVKEAQAIIEVYAEDGSVEYAVDLAALNHPHLPITVARPEVLQPPEPEEEPYLVVNGKLDRTSARRVKRW